MDYDDAFRNRKPNAEFDTYANGPNDSAGKRGPFTDAVDQLRALVEDVRLLLTVEKEYLTQRIAYTRAQLVKILIFGIAAATIAVLAVFALIVGILLSLASLVGPLLATIITVGALTIITAALAIYCRRAAKNLTLK